MKRFLLLASSLLSTVALAGELTVKDPYIQANVPGSDNTVGYLKVTNPSDSDLKITSIEAGISQKAELHVHSIVNDRMTMRQVEAIEVPAGKEVVLKPNGYHLMFINLNQRIKPGSSVDVTFNYDDGTNQIITLPVVDTKKKKQHKHQH